MEYRTVVAFDDLQDKNHRYEIGDTYPRKGLKPTKKRIEMLATAKNRRKRILIEKVEEVLVPEENDVDDSTEETKETSETETPTETEQTKVEDESGDGSK